MNIVANPLHCDIKKASPSHPKQAKLLGAVVQGVGTISAVSAELPWCFVLIEDETGREHHRFVSDLSKDELTFPESIPPYHTYNRRIGYGLFGEMMCLESPIQATDLKVA